MADKMMRIAGRDTGGLAKAIKVDTDGTVFVKQINTKRVQLTTETSVLASSSVSYEVNVDGYSEIQLSWFSSDGIGRTSTEIVFTYHRLTGNLSFNSVTYQEVINVSNGLKEGGYSTFFIENQNMQNVKNTFLTIQFKNNSATNKGLYYPTLILK